MVSCFCFGILKFHCCTNISVCVCAFIPTILSRVVFGVRSCTRKDETTFYQSDTRTHTHAHKHSTEQKFDLQISIVARHEIFHHSIVVTQLQIRLTLCGRRERKKIRCAKRAKKIIDEKMTYNKINTMPSQQFNLNRIKRRRKEREN